jgi:hypothetical protein
MLRAEIIVHYCNVSVSKNGRRKRLRKSLLLEATPIIIMTKFADKLTSRYVALSLATSSLGNSYSLAMVAARS